MEYYELINYNHHNSLIGFYKVLFNDKFYFNKISFCSESNNIIINEHNGYKWYFLRNKNLKYNIRLDKSVKNFSILIPEFQGIKLPFNLKIEGNEFYFNKILNNYIRCWNSESDFSIHGDFSFANFVLENNNIIIIDWEHFHKSNYNYFGYDFIHLIYLSIKSSTFSINTNNLNFIKKCINKLKNNFKGSGNFLNYPFQNSKRYLLKYSSRFGNSESILNKFELAYEKDKVLSEIDFKINNLWK